MCVYVALPTKAIAALDSQRILNTTKLNLIARQKSKLHFRSHIPANDFKRSMITYLLHQPDVAAAVFGKLIVSSKNYMSNQLDPSNSKSNGNDNNGEMCTNKSLWRESVCEPNRAEIRPDIDVNDDSPSPHLIEGSSYNGSDNLVLDPVCNSGTGEQDEFIALNYGSNNDVMFASSHATLPLHQEEMKLEVLITHGLEYS